MFKNLKKMLFLIPCMILGMIFVGSMNVSAINTEVVGVKSIVLGENNKENKYFFTTSRSWTFDTEYNVLVDTYLTYRVIMPTGQATKESAKINYVNAGGEFTIGDYTQLEFTETVDVSGRVTAFPASTFYIDIKYYGSYLGEFLTWDQDKDETIKLVFCDSSSADSVPTATIQYDKISDLFTIDASILKNGKAYSVIDKIEYYYSASKVENQLSNFRKNMENSDECGELDFTKNSRVSVELEGPEDKENKHLYVMVTTAHGVSFIVSYTIGEENNPSSPGEGGSSDVTGTGSNGDPSTGLFDYGLGELILLVLVVVLIVSCVLIITQKIVDHKKRLY